MPTPTIAEILAARKAAKAEQAAGKLPGSAQPKEPVSFVDPDDPDNFLIIAAMDIFAAEIEANPPEIASPFGPRANTSPDLDAQ